MFQKINERCEKQKHRKRVAQLYIITHNRRLRFR
jgi:hypothetical protein